MTALFISYGGRDREVAVRVRDRLRAEGYGALFLDFDTADGLPAGRLWEPELYAQLRKADAVVFLASSDSVKSQWCFAEISMARSLDRKVFPARIEPDVWLDLLGDVQWTDLTEGEPGFRKLVAGLRHAGLDPADSFAWDASRSPYPGLEPFDRPDAAVFFGRAKEIDRLVELFDPAIPNGAGRFVAIVGPSGSGKSSLLRAGLLPRLERLADRWVVLPAFTPGRQPVRSLARAFNTSAELTEPAQLVELAGTLGGGRRVLMVVDQAEELVTRSGVAEQQAFLRLVRGAITVDSPLWAIATVRAEFLSSAPDRAGLAEAVDYPLLVEPLSRTRLPEVIERPARWAGIQFEPGLVQRMVEDTTGGDALPLLACTLRQLYQQTDSPGTVTLAAYESMGGVVGSLHRQADKITEELKRHGHDVLPPLLKLASVSDSGEPTRRRVRRDSLSPDEQVVIQAFVDARLLTSGEDTVEVAHEALLRQWTPLRDEIEARQRSLRMRTEVERLANDWQRGGHDESYLLRGARLTAFEEYAERDPHDLGQLDREFLLASQTLARRELALAYDQRRIATGRSLLFQAEALRGTEAGMSLLVGIAAMEASPNRAARASLITTLLGNHYVATMAGHGSEVSAVAFSPLGGTLATGGFDPPVMLWDIGNPMRPRLICGLGGHTGAVWAMVFSPDGQTLITCSTDESVILWDISDLTRPVKLSVLTGGLKWVSSAALSADGRILLTGSWDNTGARDDKAVLWDISDRKHPRRLSTLADRNKRGPVRAVAISPDGAMAATGNDDAMVIVWDIRKPAQPEVVKVMGNHRNSVWAMAFHPSSLDFVTGSADQSAIIWRIADEASPELLSRLTRHDGTVRAVAFSPDGNRVVTGSWDHTAIVWDVSHPKNPIQLGTLGGHREGVFSVAFSPDNRMVATTSSDRTAILWNVETDADPIQVSRLGGHGGEAPSLAFSPNGNTIVSGGANGVAILWDVTDPVRLSRLAALTGHRAGIWPVAYSPAGRLVITGSQDRTAIVWDVGDRTHPRRLSTMAAHDHSVTSIAFGGGNLVALGSDDGTATLWDLTDPKDPRRLTRLTGHTWPVRGVPISGDTLVTCSTDSTGIVWDISDPIEPQRLATLTDENSTYSAAFSPDGRTLALAQEGRKCTLWDLSNPREPERLSVMRGQASSVYVANFSPDGQLLCTGGYDKTVILWDITDLRQPRELKTLAGNTLSVAAAVFSPTRDLLAVSGNDSPVLWDIGKLHDIVSRPVETARAITGRGLSASEWQAFAPDLLAGERLEWLEQADNG